MSTVEKHEGGQRVKPLPVMVDIRVRSARGKNEGFNP